MRTLRSSLLMGLVITVMSLSAMAQPNVIVGDITGPSNYSADGTYDAFSLGTTSCNVGNQVLTWIASDSRHPVIGGCLYKVEDGRFLHIGRSWLKHGFTALQGSVCGPCTPNPNGTALGVGCSDPYGSSLNGNQSPLGPRYQINATTGAFPYPPANPSYSGTTARRLKVRLSDLNAAPGTVFISEAQYIQYEDAGADVDNDNASYRLCNISGGPTEYSMSFAGSTVRTKAAIEGWADVDPSVVTVDAMDTDVAGGGRYIVAGRRSDSGNASYPHRFTIAIHNLNVENSAGSFTVNFPAGVNFTNMGMHSTAYNDGEPFNNNAWNITTTANGIMFEVDQAYGTNPNSNALRWGSSFTFWFDSDMETPSSMAIGKYKTAGNVNVPALPFPAPVWQTNQTNAGIGMDVISSNDPFIAPVQDTLQVGSAHSLEMESADGYPMNVAITAVPGVPALAILPGGDIINIDVTSPTFSELFTSPTMLPGGTMSLNIVAPPTAFFASVQLWAIDPTAADGVRLSALDEITVAELPRVIVQAQGSNPYNNNTSEGFWKVIHTGAHPADITAVTVDFATATGGASSLYFDTDQSGMNGVFNQGGTYRNNSDVVCGLNYAGSTPWTNSGFVATNIISTGSGTCRTVRFNFAGGLFNGTTFEFDADTDPTTQTGAGHAGVAVTVEFSDGAVLSGHLASDGTRAFVEL